MYLRISDPEKIYIMHLIFITSVDLHLYIEKTDIKYAISSASNHKHIRKN
jgi:hypothetical protein